MKLFKKTSIEYHLLNFSRNIDFLYQCRKKFIAIRKNNYREEICLSRQCEFLAGRICACQSLIKLDKQINMKQSWKQFFNYGELPLWPPGVVGSISHSEHYAIAICTRSDDRCVGVDIESIIKLKKAQLISTYVISKKDFQYAELFDEFNIFVTIVFSSKESIYKALPLHIQKLVNFHSTHIYSIDIKHSFIIFYLNINKLDLTKKIKVFFEWYNSNIITYCNFSIDGVFSS
ncbi:4'-phosphopantetheinyl transferase family protein [Vibrio aestuarianus]|uniref:4'-phosphopantetheinyl transferase family protein n=1 Tax=Vibrio aestuarianus TaxID=28171 RepID=UPI00237D2731|nr:4'-phosphopantetheinyl transferase superfamily protein [Vibrio aestuarianus]MDE1330421.1 4'-phosphopantetheinyl transferase superfamily protein [Vibrio aestuarianus]